jgi:hypothetical protein
VGQIKLPNWATSKYRNHEPTVRFSPATRDAFRKLAESLRGKEGFDQDLLPNVEMFGKDRTHPVGGVISNLPIVIEQAARYAEKTGDRAADDHLGDVLNELLEKGTKIGTTQRAHSV